MKLVASPTRFALIMSTVLVVGIFISIATIPIIQNPAGPTIGSIVTLVAALLIDRFLKH